MLMEIKIKKILLACMRGIPLFGTLPDTRRSDHWEAFTEVSVNILLSTVPIWFGVIIGRVFDIEHRASTTLFGIIVENLRSGELFLYATALLAPLYYFIFRDYRGSRRFPSSGAFMLLSALILIISGGLFAIERAESTLTQIKFLDHSSIFFLSWWMYIFAIIIVYIAHVYKNLMEGGASSITSSQTQDFVNEFISEPRG
jgi:hypothetical protein